MRLSEKTLATANIYLALHRMGQLFNILKELLHNKSTNILWTLTLVKFTHKADIIDIYYQNML